MSSSTPSLPIDRQLSTQPFGSSSLLSDTVLTDSRNIRCGASSLCRGWLVDTWRCNDVAMPSVIKCVYAAINQ